MSAWQRLQDLALHSPQRTLLVPEEQGVHRYENAFCGDELYLKMTSPQENERLSFAFDGEGCVLSMASSALMVEMIEGKKKEEVLRLADSLQRVAEEEGPLSRLKEYGKMGDLEPFVGGVVRRWCVFFPWYALKEILET